MQREPFSVLKLSPNATAYEVEDAYRKLKNKYSEERFLEGELGNNAAKKLTELEIAYEQVQVILRQREIDESYGSIYGKIEQLIKDGNIDAAQAELDVLESRTAEWHYLQSIIYYKKRWYSESKKQLEFAVNMEPVNRKYSDALNRLNNLLNNPEQYANNQQQQQYYGGQNNQYSNNSYYGKEPDPMAQMGTCCCSMILCELCAHGCC